MESHNINALKKSAAGLFPFIKEQFHMHIYQRLISVLLRMRTINVTINCPNPITQISTSTTPQRWWQQAQHQSNIDLKSFYLELSKCDYKPAILSLVSENAHNYIPKSSSPNYPELCMIKKCYLTLLFFFTNQ